MTAEVGQYGTFTGVVRVRQRVVTPTVIAPLSGRTCVAYRLFIDEAIAGQTLPWLRRAVSTGGVGFLLDGDGALALVEWAHVALDVPVDYHVESGSTRPRKAHVALLEAHGLPTRGDYRYLEGAVLAGDTVAVTGTALTAPDIDGELFRGYREHASDVLRLVGSQAKPLWLRSQPRPEGRLGPR